MASDNRSSNDRDTTFELKQRGPRETTQNPGLSLAEAPRKTVGHQPGSDPYNTSGSFDRKKNWARVGKR
jgi:hypothetical protein